MSNVHEMTQGPRDEIPPTAWDRFFGEARPQRIKPIPQDDPEFWAWLEKDHEHHRTSGSTRA